MVRLWDNKADLCGSCCKNSAKPCMCAHTSLSAHAHTLAAQAVSRTWVVQAEYSPYLRAVFRTWIRAETGRGFQDVSRTWAITSGYMQACIPARIPFQVDRSRGEKGHHFRISVVSPTHQLSLIWSPPPMKTWLSNSSLFARRIWGGRGQRRWAWVNGCAHTYTH